MKRGGCWATRRDRCAPAVVEGASCGRRLGGGLQLGRKEERGGGRGRAGQCGRGKAPSAALPAALGFQWARGGAFELCVPCGYPVQNREVSRAGRAAQAARCAVVVRTCRMRSVTTASIASARGAARRRLHAALLRGGDPKQEGALQSEAAQSWAGSETPRGLVVCATRGGESVRDGNVSRLPLWRPSVAAILRAIRHILWRLEATDTDNFHRQCRPLCCADNTAA